MDNKDGDEMTRITSKNMRYMGEFIETLYDDEDFDDASREQLLDAILNGIDKVGMGWAFAAFSEEQARLHNAQVIVANDEA